VVFWADFELKCCVYRFALIGGGRPSGELISLVKLNAVVRARIMSKYGLRVGG
jgi:hypothetical protein